MNSDADEALAQWDSKVREVLAHNQFFFFLYSADVTSIIVYIHNKTKHLLFNLHNKFKEILIGGSERTKGSLESNATFLHLFVLQY